MTDVMQRLSAALADRYRIERELGAGGMATVMCGLSDESDLRSRDIRLRPMRQQLAQVDEGPHDCDVDVDGAAAPEHAREHGDTLLREDSGKVPSAAPSF